MGNVGKKYVFRLSWWSIIPHILLLIVGVGIFTIPIQILKILTTKIEVQPDMIYGEIGILSKNIQNSPISQIQSVRADQSFFGRIFGYGNVIITTAGGGYVYKGMAKPQKIRETINSYM